MSPRLIYLLTAIQPTVYGHRARRDFHDARAAFNRLDPNWRASFAHFPHGRMNITEPINPAASAAWVSHIN